MHIESEVYCREANFDTGDWEAYKGVIPDEQHQVFAKGSGRTNIIERFNYTLRQRVSRLVRRKLSDILSQASSDVFFHGISFSKRLAPLLLVICKMCPDIRLAAFFLAAYLKTDE